MKFNLARDLREGVKMYPSLFLDLSGSLPIIKGIFPAHNGDFIIDNYEVIIRIPPAYPNALPIVEEISGKIPKIVERHVFEDSGSLCFGNHLDVLRTLKKGITFRKFLDEILNVHLCREYAREINGFYIYGERSHGMEGHWEGYYEIFNTTNKKQILDGIEIILNNQHYSKNKLCYCGSNKKFKRCHLNVEANIMDIGRSNVLNLFRTLNQHFKTISQ